MIKVYSIFSLINDEISFEDGKIYFFPCLNGTLSYTWGISGLFPIIFVKEDY